MIREKTFVRVPVTMITKERLDLFNQIRHSWLIPQNLGQICSRLVYVQVKS